MRITSESKDMATLACIKSSSPGRECEDLFDAGDRRWYQSLIGRARHIAENRHDVQTHLAQQVEIPGNSIAGKLGEHDEAGTLFCIVFSTEGTVCSPRFLQLGSDAVGSQNMLVTSQSESQC